ncbi:hypothetical protein A3860_24735 [Niastella vici]|uniref:Secretion system C-terminal sorting domain-containing protein n=1 Tax=Niastella vici TaxID=1703345 RepID=A0A1V9FZ00_9BACT|nr:T9SS type A sorting domain-containing protein [Niastella vici]OQP63550.1 hypothetical protein A3860_24735 [Niastella vici]
MQQFFRIAGSCLAVLLVITVRGYAQNNLSAGDIVIASYQSDKDLSNSDLGGTTAYTDRFSIVVTKSGGLAAGTIVYFTDNGWNASTGNFITGLSEGFIKWTVPTGGIAFGKEVFFISSYNDPATSWNAWLNENGTSTAGTVTTESGTNYMELSSGGDQLLAYQTGPTAGPASTYNNTTRRFLTAVHANVETNVTTYAAWDGTTPAGGHQSSLPTGLTNGTNAFLLSQTTLPVATVGSGEYDNGKYNGTGATTCSVTSLVTAVNTPANYVLSNTAFAIGATSNHTVFTLNNPVTIGTNPVVQSVCNGLTAAYSVAATGSGALSYQWQQSADAAFTSPVTLANNSIYNGVTTSALSILDNTGLSGKYYRAVVTNTCGPVNSNGATLTLNASLPTSAASLTQAVNTNNNLYYSSPCALITKVTPSGANAVSGNITSKVWIESSVPVAVGQPFVARHYEITPATNAATATGTVTLYFTQAEFNAFNAAPGSSLDLPTGPADNLGKTNLRVGKFSGTSNNGTGLPASYTQGAIVIDPNDADIVWNSTYSRWEVSVSVTGFSGFIIQTSTAPLPLNLISFSGHLTNSDVVLKWQTESEINHDHFEVERSTNGQNFVTVGRVAGVNTSGLQNYSFTDANAAQLSGSRLYYRLKMVSTKNEEEYSKIVTITLSDAGSPVINVTPNPFTGYVKVTVQMPEAAQLTIRLSDVTGKTLKTQHLPVAKGETIIPVTGIDQLVNGIYLLSVQYNGRMYTYKLVK